MIRTRDLLVFIVILIFATLLTGIYFSSYESTEGYGTQETAIFLIPHEAYDAVPYEEVQVRDSRDSFIEKVRATYKPQESTRSADEVVISAPDETVVSTTTETYGDTGL